MLNCTGGKKPKCPVSSVVGGGGSWVSNLPVEPPGLEGMQQDKGYLLGPCGVHVIFLNKFVFVLGATSGMFEDHSCSAQGPIRVPGVKLRLAI